MPARARSTPLCTRFILCRHPRALSEPGHGRVVLTTRTGHRSLELPHPTPVRTRGELHLAFGLEALSIHLRLVCRSRTPRGAGQKEQRMSKEIYISSTPHETRLAIVENDALAEIYYERENEYTLAGSIYNGRVTRVLPGMQSAFVDIGLERDAFLYITDFMEEVPDSAEFDTQSTGESRRPSEGGGERRGRRGGRDRGERGGDRGGERGDRGGERGDRSGGEASAQSFESGGGFADGGGEDGLSISAGEQGGADGSRRWRGRR